MYTLLKIDEVSNLGAAKKADHILIINRGQVAGYGTHDELAENSTVYEQILASQEVTE